MPVLGQAIDAYDTDLVLAIVGWIPGPGDGVKKSLRIVNRDPDRYAPVLFDMLRFVLSECGVQTSPETLLEQIFNAGHLKGQLEQVVSGVKGSKAFRVLPESAQAMVLDVLQGASQSLPEMVGVVQRRIQRWKKVQRNSSAQSSPQGHASKPKPDKRDADVATKGKDAAVHGHAGEMVNAEIAQQPLARLSNEMVGISGEHIADYICAENFGWGRDWQGHDKGDAGEWSGKPPGKQRVGKLSRNGKLYKLSDGANGTGIDSVWRAYSETNGRKPYAIVEAKASKDEDGPKFAKLPGSTRKPSIRSKLLDNAPDFNPKADELLEPMTSKEDTAATASPAGPPSGRSSKGGSGRPRRGGVSTPARATAAKPAKVDAAKAPREILVQMSPEWIEANLLAAVGLALARDISKRLPGDVKNYRRHLFFAPYWHPSGSPKAHMKARRMLESGQAAASHEAHAAYHYDDETVGKAANARKQSLSAKFGRSASLTLEKL